MKLLLLLSLLVSSCVATDFAKPKEIRVGDQMFLFFATTATGSCTEITTGYLTDQDGKLLDKATSAGATLPCAVLAGSVASAAIAAGLYNSGDKLSSSAAAESKSSSNSSSHSYIRNHYQPVKRSHGDKGKD